MRQEVILRIVVNGTIIRIIEKEGAFLVQHKPWKKQFQMYGNAHETLSGACRTALMFIEYWCQDKKKKVKS